MPINAPSVTYCVVGGFVLFSGIKGSSLSDTAKAFLSGDLSQLKGTEPVQFGSGNGTGGTNPGGPAGAPVSGAAGIMLSYMRKQVGKHYSEDTSINPATHQEKRFGPSEFDCSGLIYAAANQKGTGINLPASQAIASLEAQWFAALQGASTVKSSSAVQAGDLIFFTGASPGPSSFGPIGHVGICSSPGTMLSAYDTQMGVTYTPFSHDQFVVGVRLLCPLTRHPSPTA